MAGWVLERLDEAEPGVLAPAPRRELNPARPGSTHVAVPARPAIPPPLPAEVTVSMEQATVVLDQFSLTDQRPASDSPAEPDRAADPAESASSTEPASSIEPASSADGSAEPIDTTEPAEPATTPGTTELVESGDPEEEVAVFYPLEHLTPVGELTSVNPTSIESASVPGTDQAPVIPLLRGAPAHASQAQSKSKGPRHRAPEPVTSLHTRRKW